MHRLIQHEVVLDTFHRWPVQILICVLHNISVSMGVVCAGRTWSISRLLSLSWDPSKAHADAQSPRGEGSPRAR